MAESNASMFDLLLDELTKAMWRWRLELALLTTIAVGYYAMTLKTGPILAGVIVGVIIAPVLSFGRTRRFLVSKLELSSQRRRFEFHIRLQDSPLQPPSKRPILKKVDALSIGVRLTVKLRRGTAFTDLEKLGPRLAVSYAAREVRITQDKDNSSKAYVTIAIKDPFGDESIMFPYVYEKPLCVWSPIPIGVDEDHKEVQVALPERNLLIGGMPGSGKSVLVNVLLASLARDPKCRLFLFDGKGVDLVPWKPVASGYVGLDVEAGTAQLDKVIEIMNGRYQEMAKRGLSKLGKSNGVGLVAVVVDEAPFYVANSDTKAAKAFSSRLREIIQKGRAAGIVVILTAQKPSADTLPSSIRDLINLRIAFSCSTREASETILGGSWSLGGYSAHQIALEKRGVALFLGDGGIPILVKIYFISNEEIKVAVTNARKWRAIRRARRVQ